MVDFTAVFPLARLSESTRIHTCNEVGSTTVSPYEIFPDLTDPAIRLIFEAKSPLEPRSFTSKVALAESIELRVEADSSPALFTVMLVENNSLEDVVA